MFDEEYKKLLKRMFVDNGQYKFDSENKAERFINKVFSLAEDLYRDECYYHRYEDFREFLYTSHVDGIAYYVFEGEYGDY